MTRDPGREGAFRSSSLSTTAGCVLLIAVACGGDSSSTSSNEPRPQPNDSSFTSTGTIAFARGGEIRLVEPDGSAEHSIWTAPPGLGFTVSGIGWRPNGGALAFSSDHEMATSFYERDIYAVLPDGNHLRKLTNGPTHAELASHPKGTVQVTVQNNTSDGGTSSTPWGRRSRSRRSSLPAPRRR